MSEPPRWRRYLRMFGPDVARDVDAELEFHIEERVAELVAAGHSPAAAREEALRRAGDLAALKRACTRIGESREAQQRRRLGLDGLRLDLRLALRQCVRAPLVTVIAVLTLALGLGVNTAVFGVVYAVLLRPLPFDHADRLVAISETVQGVAVNAGPGQFAEWRRSNRTLEAISAEIGSTANLTGAGEPERLAATLVTPDYFRVLHAPPVAGRYFLGEEIEPGRDRVAVLSHALFLRRFAGDPAIIGSAITLNGASFVVVGVASPSYALAPDAADLWLPMYLANSHYSDFASQWLRVRARLLPGVTVQAAQRDLERVTAEIARAHPVEMKDRSVHVRDLRGQLVSSAQRQIVLLFGAVGFVLLLAVLNLTNLLLARVTVRRNEIAVRAALGAGRGRIVRQLLTETMVLTLLGALGAIVVARVTMAALTRLAPAQIPRLQDTGFSTAVFGFLFLLAIVSGALPGLVPALRATGRTLADTLRRSGRMMPGSRDLLRGALIVAEVAFALVLLNGAVLFVRSGLRLQHVEPGFTTDNVLVARVALPPARYNSAPAVSQAFNDMLREIRSTPGVTAASAISQVPLEGGSIEIDLQAGDSSSPPRLSAHFRMVAPGYFETLNIPIVKGRALTEQDRAAAAPVVVINATLARRLWPAQDPIGQRMRCCSDNVWREVVGVSADVRHRLAEAPLPELYVPHEQAPAAAASWLWVANSLAFVVRTAGEPADFLQSVRSAVARVDPDLPVHDVRTMHDLLQRATAVNRFNARLFSALALIALLLAGVGVYGVLAYFVAQRRQEIGLRLALGARAFQVVRFVVRQAATLAAAGLVAGLLLSLFTSRAARPLLFEIVPGDPLTYLLVTAGLGAVVLLASWIPARRAAALQPQDALRP